MNSFKTVSILFLFGIFKFVLCGACDKVKCTNRKIIKGFNFADADRVRRFGRELFCSIHDPAVSIFYFYFFPTAFCWFPVFFHFIQSIGHGEASQQQSRLFRHKEVMAGNGVTQPPPLLPQLSTVPSQLLPSRRTARLPRPLPLPSNKLLPPLLPSPHSPEQPNRSALASLFPPLPSNPLQLPLQPITNSSPLQLPLLPSLMAPLLAPVPSHMAPPPSKPLSAPLLPQRALVIKKSWRTSYDNVHLTSFFWCYNLNKRYRISTR